MTAYVRVRDLVTGTEWSEPAESKIIARGLVRVVDRKPVTAHPMPAKTNPLRRLTTGTIEEVS